MADNKPPIAAWAEDEAARKERLEDLLERLVALAHAEGIDHPLLDECEEVLAESPLRKALVQTAGDIIAGKPGTQRIAVYEDMLDYAKKLIARPAQVCATCGKPATCYGSYEGLAPSFACDVCCGHGNEDGHCDLLAEEVIP